VETSGDGAGAREGITVHLEELCVLELRYVDGFHYASPYDGRSGVGWGRGDGTATGDRLNGEVQWSNHPRGRGDGSMLPEARGVIATPDGAEVLFDLTGRTVFVDRDGEQVGRQLLMTLFESDHDGYRWLNDTVCITEGAIDPVRLAMRMQVYRCLPDLT
jgi:hypothetical protein